MCTCLPSEFQKTLFSRSQFRAVSKSPSKICPVTCYCLSLSGAFSWKQSCSLSSFDFAFVASSRYSGRLVLRFVPFVGSRQKAHFYSVSCKLCFFQSNSTALNSNSVSLLWSLSTFFDNYLRDSFNLMFHLLVTELILSLYF